MFRPRGYWGDILVYAESKLVSSFHRFIEIYLGIQNSYRIMSKTTQCLDLTNIKHKSSIWTLVDQQVPDHLKRKYELLEFEEGDIDEYSELVDYKLNGVYENRIIVFRYKNGNRRLRCEFHRGRLHSTTGPAITKFDSYGYRTYGIWFLYGDKINEGKLD
jgi:hypothetical protein